MSFGTLWLRATVRKQLLSRRHKGAEEQGTGATGEEARTLGCDNESVQGR